jgi:pimeloyl-ACP methyl ester carboxylesterase
MTGGTTSGFNLLKSRLEISMQLQQLTAGHGALTAARTGQGRDIVLLHPLLADRHVFDPLVPVLAEKHRVTLFNLPGFHGSEPVVTALLDAYVARIEDGFQEFKIDKDAILIGIGFGGTLALAFALDHPERVARLVVSNAAASLAEDGRREVAAVAGRGRSPMAGWVRSPRSRAHGFTLRIIWRHTRSCASSADACCSTSTRRRSPMPARFCRRST